MASYHLSSTHTGTHQRMTTIWVPSSDEYLSSREDILRNATPGPSRIQRSPEPPEIQQPVPVRVIRSPNRGPAFLELKRGNPNLSPEDNATIAAWFEQTIPAIL